MTESKLYVGYKRCSVYDELNVKRCVNCSLYGHNSNKCRNNITCVNCSEIYQASDCKNTKIKCKSCLETNTKYKLELSTEHKADDINNLQVVGKTKNRKHRLSI